MARLNLTLTLFMFLICQISPVKACGIDVSIIQGDTVRMCPESITNVSAYGGYTLYNWYGGTTGATQAITPVATGWYFVDATDGVACVSTDSIYVLIYSTQSPVIQSSEGPNICPGSSGTVLSLASPYVTYVWSTSETSPSINTTISGDYSIDVMDANGCSGSSSITLGAINFEIIPSVSGKVCNATLVGLHAKDGDAFLWSTGATTDYITVSPDETTTYTVSITNGSCVGNVSYTLEVHKLPLNDLPDTLFYGENDNKGIEAPFRYESFHWSPENLVDDSVAQITKYVGQQSGMLYLTMYTAEGCPLTDSLYIEIVRLTIPEGFSPNGDFVNDTFEIPELTKYKGQVTFWNRWGEIVLNEDHYKNDWTGKCKSLLCVGNDDLPEGTYFYAVNVHDVKFKGFITLKR